MGIRIIILIYSYTLIAQCATRNINTNKKYKINRLVMELPAQLGGENFKDTFYFIKNNKYIIYAAPIYCFFEDDTIKTSYKEWKIYAYNFDSIGILFNKTKENDDSLIQLFSKDSLENSFIFNKIKLPIEDSDFNLVKILKKKNEKIFMYKDNGKYLNNDIDSVIKYFKNDKNELIYGVDDTNNRFSNNILYRARMTKKNSLITDKSIKKFQFEFEFSVINDLPFDIENVFMKTDSLFKTINKK